MLNEKAEVNLIGCEKRFVNRLQNHSETSQKNTLYEKRAKYIAKRIEILEEQMHKARQIDEGLSKRLEKLNCDHRN